jgi:hypothetical protein
MSQLLSTPYTSQRKLGSKISVIFGKKKKNLLCTYPYHRLPTDFFSRHPNPSCARGSLIWSLPLSRSFLPRPHFLPLQLSAHSRKLHLPPCCSARAPCPLLQLAARSGVRVVEPLARVLLRPAILSLSPWSLFSPAAPCSVPWLAFPKLLPPVQPRCSLRACSRARSSARRAQRVPMVKHAWISSELAPGLYSFQPIESRLRSASSSIVA